ncbi:MAG TPA: extracellular solute-binding protein [Anaerolineales bacterium]|nr:extracellular solute-binding protein [Anaerolineales bacterium]
MIFRRSFSISFLFLLVACQPVPDLLTATPSPRARATPQPTSTPQAVSKLGVSEGSLKGITIQVWQPWFGVEANLFQLQVDEFNQTNQWGIIVQSTSQLDYNELFQSVGTSLSANNGPQLVVGLPEYALAWNADDEVVDLTPYVNDPKYGLSDSDIKDIPSVFWDQDEVGGVRLGIPAERSARYLLYNVSWAHELGFNSAPVTADDFRRQACAAHATLLADKDRSNDAMGGWLVDTQAMTALSWLAAFGGGVLAGNNYHFLTPNNIAAFSFVKQLYGDGCAWSTSDPSGVYEAFADRKALFSTASLEELSDQSRAMAAADNSDEWTVLAFPGSSQSGLYIYGSSYIVLKSTPEQQLAAWLFVHWMFSPENQAKWVDALGFFPLRASSLDLLKDYSNSHPQWNAALALLPSAAIQPQLASWRVVRSMLGDGFSYMFRSGLDNQPAIASNQPAAILSQMDSIAREISK